jgi:hypothetical protein
MKPLFTGLAIAASLVVAAGLPGYAEDATASKIPPTPTATQTGAPPASLPRPSLTPKTAEPASLPDVAGPAPNGNRRSAGRYLHLPSSYRVLETVLDPLAAFPSASHPLAPDILSVQFPTPAPLTGCGLSRMSLIFVASTTWVRGF